MNPPHRTLSASSLTTHEASLIQAQAYRTLNKVFSGYLAEHGLSLSDWSLLGLVSTHQPLTHSAIAEQLDVSPTMATKIVNRLEQQRFLSRTIASRDSRVKYVSITPGGLALITKVEPILRQRMRRFLVGVDPNDLDIYLGVLSYIAHAENIS